MTSRHDVRQKERNKTARGETCLAARPSLLLILLSECVCILLMTLFEKDTDSRMKTNTLMNTKIYVILRDADVATGLPRYRKYVSHNIHKNKYPEAHNPARRPWINKISGIRFTISRWTSWTYVLFSKLFVNIRNFLYLSSNITCLT